MTSKKKYTISDQLFDVATDSAAPIGEDPTQTGQTEQSEPQAKRTRRPTLRPRENRSKRFNLLITPALYSKLEKESAAAGFRSVNDFINAILESYLK